MEEAAKRKIRVVVLDRPNPIGGWQIEGPALDEAAIGFTGYIPSMPTRHGMTLGELAKLFNAEAQDRLRPRRGRDAALVARPLVRRDRARVDQPVAEHAEPDPGHALSGHRQHRVRQPVGGPRHRHAVRADRRALDRRPSPGRRAQRAPAARRPRLPGVLHARRRASSPASGARACSSSSPTARRSSPCGSGSRWPPRSSRCTRARSIPAARRFLLGSSDALARVRTGEDPADGRPRRGPSPSRAGGRCARSICCIDCRLQAPLSAYCSPEPGPRTSDTASVDHDARHRHVHPDRPRDLRDAPMPRVVALEAARQRDQRQRHDRGRQDDVRDQDGEVHDPDRRPAPETASSPTLAW